MTESDAASSEDRGKHAKFAGEDDNGFVYLRGRARLTNAGKMVLELLRALAPILVGTGVLLAIYFAARAGFEPAKTGWLAVRYGLAIGAAMAAVYLLLDLLLELLFDRASSLASIFYLASLTVIAFVAAPSAGVLYFKNLISNAHWIPIAGGVVALVCVSWIVGERVAPWGWWLESRLDTAYAALSVASKIVRGRPLDMWSKSVQCPACDVRSNEIAPRFCGECGIEFGAEVRPTRSPFSPEFSAEKLCDDCGQGMHRDARFCGDCGHENEIEPESLARRQLADSNARVDRPDQRNSDGDQVRGDQVREGDIVAGTVIQLDDEFVVVDIGAGWEGRVDIDEFRDQDGVVTVRPGDDIQVLLESVEGEDGLLVLSKEKADRLFVWDEISAACERREKVVGTVSARVDGGWSVTLSGGVQALLPDAQEDLGLSTDIAAVIGKTRRFSVIEFSKKDGKIVLSTRVPEEDQAGREDIAPEPRPGQADSAAANAVPTAKHCALCYAPSPQDARYCGKCGHVLEAERAR